MYQLYLVTQDYEDIDFFDVITQACQHGVTMVQLREKTLSTAAFYQKAKAVKAITDQYHIPLIINDRVDICLAIDADGVHIGDDELPVAVVRQLLPNKVIGVTAKTVTRALEAQKQGANYLGVGALFPTQTKQTKSITVPDLQTIVDAVNIPVVAIGGITVDNVAMLKGTGIQGVAIVSDIMRAKSVAQHVIQLSKEVEDIIHG